MLVPLIKPAAAYDVPQSATNNAMVAMPWRRMRFPMSLIPMPPVSNASKGLYEVHRASSTTGRPAVVGGPFGADAQPCHAARLQSVRAGS